MTANLIVTGARITTLAAGQPAASALGAIDGRIARVGTDAEVMALAGPTTTLVDLGGRRVIPGLIDSHMHIIRGGLNYNLELRWDGVRSLATAMEMMKAQVARTPAPQWVRVVGGFTEHQFSERRLPTVDELNAVAPETPVFILHLYDRALLNAAALRACGYSRDTPNPPGGEIVRDAAGRPTGLLLAKPNAMILYSTLARGPRLPYEYQVNSTRHFLREMNRLGVTGVIDAGGGFQNYPDDYRVMSDLHDAGDLTVRIAYNLFTQRPREELADFSAWVSQVRPGQGDDSYRHNGAGEMLVFSAADFEDFREPRPDLSPSMEGDLDPVVRLLVENRWPFRLHATYDESIGRSLDVFERVNRDVPFSGIHWFFDHAETVSERNIERIAALGGGIAIQHRMAYQGEYFIERYGVEAAANTPPVQKILAMGVPLGAGTDATRVASYNPWISLAWLVTGCTVAGTRLYAEKNCVDRDTALRLWTERNAWFSTEQGKKGQLVAGQLADFAVLDRDYFAVPAEEIADIQSVLTVVGGRIVHGADGFGHLAPRLPDPMPDWSPVRFHGGYQHDGPPRNTIESTGHASIPCGVHGVRGHRHSPVASDQNAFWGALGCSCWAF